MYTFRAILFNTHGNFFLYENVLSYSFGRYRSWTTLDGATQGNVALPVENVIVRYARF